MGLFSALTVLLVGSVVLSLITTHKNKLKEFPIIGDYATDKLLKNKEIIIIGMIALSQLIL
jgi:hypothetical protein